MHVCVERAENARGARRKARAVAPLRARRAQDRDRALQLSAKRREYRHGRVSLGLRVAAPSPRRDEERGLRRRGARQRSTRCEPRSSTGNAARLRRAGQCACQHPDRRPCPPRALAWLRSKRNGARRRARQQSDGASIHVLGARFGNVFVGIQPAFGYEGDPMRLLFEKGFSPTHAFSAFYRWLQRGFRRARGAAFRHAWRARIHARASKSGLSESCWPDRLIGDLPNLYLYASNNPSEGAIAKRRAAATLISYLTPPVANAGLYRGLVDLKVSLDRWRQVGARRLHSSARSSRRSFRRRPPSSI